MLLRKLAPLDAATTTRRTQMEHPRQTSRRLSLRARAHPVALMSGLVIGLAAMTTTAYAATTPTTRPPVVSVSPAQSAAPTLPAAAATKTTRAAAVRTTTKAATKRRAATTKKAATATSFRVSGVGKGGVAVRSAPGVAAAAIGRKAEGVVLRISCQVKGEVVRDSKLGRASALWDRLVTGGYVANVYTTAYNAKTVGYTTGLHKCSGTIPTVPKRTTTATTIAVANGNVAAAGVTTTTAP